MLFHPVKPATPPEKPSAASGATVLEAASSVWSSDEKYTLWFTVPLILTVLNLAHTFTPVGTVNVAVTANVPGLVASTSSTAVVHRNSSPNCENALIAAPVLTMDPIRRL